MDQSKYIKASTWIKANYKDISHDMVVPKTDHGYRSVLTRLIPHNVMNPSTPSSIDTMENATQSEQRGFGMKTSEMIIITTAASVTLCTVVGSTIKN